MTYMKVVCYGDSNTFGFDPRSYLGDRYDPKHRWVDILSQKLKWEVQNQGMNGREISHHPIHFSEDINLLIIMLGTNDLLQGNSAASITKKMERFLDSIDIKSETILLIAPPPLKPGSWVQNHTLITESEKLARHYSNLSKERKIHFADASQWDIDLAFDGVHFSEEGHITFASKLYHHMKYNLSTNTE